jgi:hypothetical protein
MKSDILYLKQVAFALRFRLVRKSGIDAARAPFLAKA